MVSASSSGGQTVSRIAFNGQGQGVNGQVWFEGATLQPNDVITFTFAANTLETRYSSSDFRITESGVNILTGNWILPPWISFSDSISGGSSDQVSGTTIQANPFNVPQGLTFVGWYDSDEWSNDVYVSRASGEAVDFSTLTSTLYLNAEWSAPITFDAGAGSGAPASINMSSVLNAVIPSGLPIRSGYTFSGWTDGSRTYQPGNTVSFNNYSGPVSLSALWAPNPRNVTFDANDGAGTATVTQQSASSTTLAGSTFTRIGYAFMGWSRTPTGTVEFLDKATYDFSTDVTLYAKWAAANLASASSSGGLVQGVNPQDITISWVNTASIPVASSQTGSSIKLVLNGLANDAISRFANTCWPNAQTPCYGVTLTSSSGALVNVGKYVSAAASNKVEFTFYVGANAIPAGSTLTFTIPSGVVSLASSSTVSVQTKHSPTSLEWTSNAALNAQLIRTVNYDTANGSALSSGTFAGTLSQPAQTTRPGYTFTGWYSLSTGGSVLSFPYTPTGTGTVTLYGRWSANTNVVTYDVGGGSAVADGSFITGGTLTLPAAPSKNGHSFVGWYDVPTGGTPLASGYSPANTAAMTVYARWLSLSSSVSFDANGGSGSMSAQTSGSAAVLTTNTITRAGYGFTGWNTAANGSGTAYAVDATHPFTSSETLYAQWRALPATPVAAVDIQVPVGSAIANAPVDLDVDGLKDQTGYTVTVFSTPQIIDQGTIWSGRLNTTVRIPSNLEAGWHRLVIVGTAADGTPWTEENYFKVSPGGILLATSEVVPAELAMTGSQAVPVFYSAGFLILLGFGFLAANVTLRRRNNK